MRKTFVLDTNVLLHDPAALNRFEDNNILIPIEVVEEIDRFKRDPAEKGRNARQVSRLLDSLRAHGNLADGVPNGEQGGTLKVVFCRAETLSQLPPELKGGSGDNNILAVALEEQRLQAVLGSQPPVVLVTKDTNLRIKADAVGLIAQDYTSDRVAISDLYPGFCEVWVDAEQMDRVKLPPGLAVEGLVLEAPLQANEGVTLIDRAQPAHTLLARYNSATASLQPLQRAPKAKLGRIQPRNREQTFALDLLLDPSIQLITLVGKAGTGKTLLALAAGAGSQCYDSRAVGSAWPCSPRTGHSSQPATDIAVHAPAPQATHSSHWATVHLLRWCPFPLPASLFRVPVHAIFFLHPRPKRH